MSQENPDALKCTNAEPGTYGHECGKPAQWQAAKPNGYTSTFCDRCRQDGTEARAYGNWTPYKEPTE
jgi:hypothetical protein